MKRIFEIIIKDEQTKDTSEIFGGSLEETIAYAKTVIGEHNKKYILRPIHFVKFYLTSRSCDKYVRLTTMDENSHEGNGRRLIINELSIEQLLDLISLEIRELETLKEETTKQILEKEINIDKLKELLI